MNSRKGQRLVAVAALGWLLLNYPLVSLFNHSTWFGVPATPLAILLSWAALIALNWLIIERTR